jgi:hypothetical protein
MNVNRIFSRVSLGVIGVALCLSAIHVSAEETGSDPMELSRSQTPSAVPVIPEGSRLARLLKEARFSSGVSDIVRLNRAGTDPAVLIAHVQASDHARKLRPEDITHLKDNAVPDSVIASMIVRRAEVRTTTPSVSPPTPTLQGSPSTASATVTIVQASQRRATPPVSTVTVIGRSDLSRGLSYRNHFYSSRNFYSGTYGRVYAAYDRYSFRSPWYRRGHGTRVCR